MTPEYWLKQTKETPLFPDILWSRPEHKSGAGKLFIIGGNAMGFSAVQEAYKEADRAGAGAIRIVLPDALRKTVGPLMPGEFVPSTPSGSLARKALSDLLGHTEWADAVLIAGDLGRNSETAVLLESFVQKYQGPLVITKDAVDYFYGSPLHIAERPDTALVLSLSQLQKLGTALKFETPFLLSMGMLLLAQALHTLSSRYPLHIVTKELDSILVASDTHVSSTKLAVDKEIWRTETAAAVAVLWMQNPSKPFEAITSSLVV